MSRWQCIIDGFIKPYDIAAPVRNNPYSEPYDRNMFICIGNGFVYSVGGILQRSKTLLTFYIVINGKNCETAI